MDIYPDIFENTKVAFSGKSDADLRKARALFQLMGNNSLVRAGSSLASLALAMHLPVSPLFRWTVYDHFCGGETFEECKQTIQGLNDKKAGVLLNYGVELKKTDADFDKTIEKNIEALEFAGQNRSVKGLCIKLTGFGRLDLFEKIQRAEKLNGDEQDEFARFNKRLDRLCDVAAKNSVPLYIDAEESWIQNALDAVVEERIARYNKGQCIVFNTIQLYRWDRSTYLQEQLAKARAGGYLLGVKLVRGAYMEKERERAAAMNYRSPIHENKAGVDKDFDEAVNLCLENLETISVCIASQSEASNLLAIQQINARKINSSHSHIIFSQLYGMGDNITFNLAEAGFNVAKYLPYGPVKDVIPYLIRRAQENTSVAGQTGRELSLLKKEIGRRKKK